MSALVIISNEGICEVAVIDEPQDNLRVITVYRLHNSNSGVFLGVIERVLLFNADSKVDTVFTGHFNVRFHINVKEWLALQDLNYHLVLGNCL